MNLRVSTHPTHSTISTRTNDDVAPPPAPLSAITDDTVGRHEHQSSSHGFWSSVAGANGPEPAAAPNPPANAPSLADIRAGTASIQPEQRGSSVSDVQRLLTQGGYGVSATGTYGPTTRGLVEELQRDAGLPANGTIDRATLAAIEDAASHPPGKFTYGGTSPAALRDKHAGHADSFRVDATPTQQGSIDAFRTHYEANRERYEAAAEKANVPPELIAAIHWRESTGDFSTYLHNCDRLGRPTVNVPAGILFNDWESAAADALARQAQPELGLTRDSTDMPAMAAYAELYNGTGYHNRERPSPYVYAGTDEYSGGKYVRDGVYDPNHYDQQPGVLALMRAVRPSEPEAGE